MAWRFHEHILLGELDNTVRGRVAGRLWLAGIAEPMTLLTVVFWRAHSLGFAKRRRQP